ncbi:hypothetical protein DDB_G0275761 [Dictyostelium discoideum AX4]|uniref:Uncharacterized protein n=1 Tax=Dictyostelium discoideum TaxID=44689 RepID=Q553A8_DICDI|nr:hypothetical protein DDB_G0275761 [Dictyostelium discoideum AX4]EAL69631.1 hypothetical protein DDB_G0275761 [Dictyostelium discoideum AX4]|eukprot:XP_643512.1 hypothetical protein DDB_G0275761 [Dictyostelium discoideum AX4]
MTCGEKPTFKELFVVAVLDHPIVFGILFGLMFISIGFIVHNFRKFKEELDLAEKEREMEEKEEEEKESKKNK